MTSQTFFFIFIPILAGILLAVNFIFATHNPYQEKDSVFECGFHSFLGQNRTEFTISFFIFALLFLLFDLEILLVYPYIVSNYNNSVFGLIIILIFLLVLTLGFVFEIGKNALSIESRQNKDVENNALNNINNMTIKNRNEDRCFNKNNTLYTSSYLNNELFRSKVSKRSFSTSRILMINSPQEGESSNNNNDRKRELENTQSNNVTEWMDLERKFCTNIEKICSELTDVPLGSHNNEKIMDSLAEKVEEENDKHNKRVGDLNTVYEINPNTTAQNLDRMQTGTEKVIAEVSEFRLKDLNEITDTMRTMVNQSRTLAPDSNQSNEIDDLFNERNHITQQYESCLNRIKTTANEYEAILKEENPVEEENTWDSRLPDQNEFEGNNSEPNSNWGDSNLSDQFDSSNEPSPNVISGTKRKREEDENEDNNEAKHQRLTSREETTSNTANSQNIASSSLQPDKDTHSTTAAESNYAKGSLLDDFADTTSEPADYIGGDD